MSYTKRLWSSVGALALSVALLSAIAAPALAEYDDDMTGTDEGHVEGRPVLEPRAAATFSGVYSMYFPVVGPNTYTDTYSACRGGPDCPRLHLATDIMADKMTPVVAVAAGTVGWTHDVQGGNCCAMWLDHDDGWSSAYIHLNNDTPDTDDGLGWGLAEGIASGVHVEAGQLIGWVGDSGNAESSPPHLHFELYEPGDVRTNPYPHLLEATVLAAPLAGSPLRGCDFNADGLHDLAVGAPGEDLGKGKKPDAGTVTVLYGTPGGLSSLEAQRWHQGSPGVLGSANPGDLFGAVTACGDVNGDGFGDLVVGAPGEDIRSGEVPDSGAINILYGSTDGLQAVGDNYWTLKRREIPLFAVENSRFGAALAVADLTGDGYDDIAVGAPGRRRGGKADAGVVVVLEGSPDGIDGTSTVWAENSPNIGGKPKLGANFGASVIAGDFDGSAPYDLAIGVPGRGVVGLADAGAIYVLYGAEGGLTGVTQRFDQGDEIPGDLGGGHRFGAALTAGDFDHDEVDDLVVGSPGEVIGGAAAGAVTVIYGSGSGLLAATAERFDQSQGLIAGGPIDGGGFGGSFAVGEFGGDDAEDLAIGVPGATAGKQPNAGRVVVIYGSAAGLGGGGSDKWTQNTNGIEDAAEPGDGFGTWLGSGRFGGGGHAALAVGVPGEGVGDREGAGAVNVINGASSGLSKAGDQLWHMDVPGIPGKIADGTAWSQVAAAAI